MTIRHFRIFIAAARTESITKAAEELVLSQKTVRGVLRELEEHYGTYFFRRTGQRMRLTEEGKKFFKYAVQLIDLYDGAGQSDRDPDVRGTLWVGASVSVGIYYIPALTREFNRKFPNITVQVKINTTEALEKLLLENQLDLAIVGNVIQSGLIHVTYLFMERHLAVCAPDHSLAGQVLTLREFLEQPLLFRERGSGAFESFQKAVAQAGCTAEPAWESSSPEALLEAIRCGLGVTVLPEKFAREEMKARKLSQIYLSDFVFENKVCLAYHRKKYLSSVMKCFMDTAKKIMV